MGLTKLISDIISLD